MKLVVFLLLLSFSFTSLHADTQTDVKIKNLEDSLLKLEKIVKKFQEESDDLDSVITNLEQNSLKMNGYINSYYVAYAGLANVERGWFSYSASFIYSSSAN